jgi:hypothetical protein
LWLPAIDINPAQLRQLRLIQPYFDAVVINGSMTLPFMDFYDITLVKHEINVALGQWNLRLEQASKEAVAMDCLLDTACIERVIREKIGQNGLNPSMLQVGRVTIRGVNGAQYTELVFETTIEVANLFVDQVCRNGRFYNSGGACPGNAGYSGDVFGPHPGFNYAFRDNNVFNGLNINIDVDLGIITFDIDQGNPATGVLGMITHFFQWFGNAITGSDSTYGCERSRQMTRSPI